ncbi:hypothetical protein E1264_36050 [Actinomadura sp. KC216]|nr:hypothetical protein E1264_36050 [Actinomadura sp. KC216]
MRRRRQRAGRGGKARRCDASPTPNHAWTASQRAVLTTCGGSPAEWLRAGQALQRVLRAGRVRKVSVLFSFQVGNVTGVEDVTLPGEVPQVLVELTQDVRSRLLQPAVGRQDEGQGRRERIG